MGNPHNGFVTIIDGATVQRDMPLHRMRTDLGEFSETMPRVKTCGELFAMERGAQQVSLEREVLPNRAEAR